ncbi:MAG TPA: ISNCY family transposase [Terriglobales bacterium]|nr:ISNCY family transposase [Terriglobales bacterium]
MGLYPARALERAMKIQEVILRAMSGEILWMQAAEIIGISDRSMRRWRERYQEHGYDGLFDRRTQRPSPKRVPMATVEKVLRLYREKYFDFNVRHFVEKVRKEHGIELSYTWIKTALQTAGLVAKSRKQGTHRKKRPRRPLPGMMLHVDGSTHSWLGGDQRQDLVAILDDATTEVYYARLVAQESTATVMAGLKSVIEQKGLFCSLYSDRGSHFFRTPVAGEPPEKAIKTQIARALGQLGIEMIPAYSPQARGRCERFFGTWQGRLPQELRSRGITTMEGVNDFLRRYWIRYHNSHFTTPAAQSGTAFVPYAGTDLNKIFSHQEERVVGNDNTVKFGPVQLQIQPQTFRFSMAKCRVLVCQHLDETMSLYYGPHLLGRYDAQGEALTLAGARRSKNRAA